MLSRQQLISRAYQRCKVTANLRQSTLKLLLKAQKISENSRRLAVKTYPAKLLFLPFFVSLLACRPVIAIGWEELLLLAGIILLLLGPPFWRFSRRKKKKEKEKKK